MKRVTDVQARHMDDTASRRLTLFQSARGLHLAVEKIIIIK